MAPTTVSPEPIALVCTRSTRDCNSLCIALKAVGIGVLQVSDLEDGFRQAAVDCFALIVLDLDLDPQWRSTLSVLQQVAPSAALVAYSHSPDERLWIDALEAGAFDFVCPPICQRDLAWILENALKARIDRPAPESVTLEVQEAIACCSCN